MTEQGAAEPIGPSRAEEAPTGNAVVPSPAQEAAGSGGTEGVTMSVGALEGASGGDPGWGIRLEATDKGGDQGGDQGRQSTQHPGPGGLTSMPAELITIPGGEPATRPGPADQGVEEEDEEPSCDVELFTSGKQEGETAATATRTAGEHTPAGGVAGPGETATAGDGGEGRKFIGGGPPADKLTSSEIDDQFAGGQAAGQVHSTQGGAVGGAWKEGRERPFAWDPNSTIGEGRWRLYPPGELTGYFRRNSTTAGVSYVLGKDKGGKAVVQAVRFSKGAFTEAAAARWWEENRGAKGLRFYGEAEGGVAAGEDTLGAEEAAVAEFFGAEKTVEEGAETEVVSTPRRDKAGVAGLEELLKRKESADAAVELETRITRRAGQVAKVIETAAEKAGVPAERPEMRSLRPEGDSLVHEDIHAYAEGLIRKIEAGEADARKLTIHERRACVAVLLYEPITRKRIASFLRVTYRTVISDIEAIRQGLAKLANPAEIKVIVGGLIEDADSMKAKALSEGNVGLAWKITTDLIDQLQKLGYLGKELGRLKVTREFEDLSDAELMRMAQGGDGGIPEEIIDLLRPGQRVHSRDGN